MDVILFMLDEGGGNRTYHTKSGADCLCDKMEGNFSNDLATHLAHPFYDSMDFNLFMLHEGLGNRTYYTKSGPNCLLINAMNFLR